MNFKQKLVLFLGTGFFCGNIAFAPGTLGSLAGLPFCYFLSNIDQTRAFAGIILFIILAIWIAQMAEKIIKQKDPGCIVIDEMAGIMVTLWGLPFNIITVLAGFIIFRILDIAKPFPISYVEKKLSGGTGIVADDVVAGVIGNLILRTAFIAVESFS